MFLSWIGIVLMYISTFIASSIYFNYKFPFRYMGNQTLTASNVLELTIYLLPVFCLGYYLVHKKDPDRTIKLLLHCVFMYYLLSNGYGFIFFILSSIALLVLYWIYNKHKELQEKLKSNKK